MESRDGPTRVEIVRRQRCYDGFFRLEAIELRHERFAGGMTPPLRRELLERGHAVGLLPYDPLRDEVVLIEQFRVGALEDPRGPWLLEIVAGVADDGETPEAVALREAAEEAGCTPDRLEPIHTYYSSPGGSTEIIRLFCGRVDAARLGGLHGLEAEGEDIRAFAVPFETAWAWVQAGRIDSAAPIIALQWLALNRARLRETWLAAPAP